MEPNYLSSDSDDSVADRNYEPSDSESVEEAEDDTFEVSFSTCYYECFM